MPKLKNKKKFINNLKCLSLFASAGIGELGIKNNGIEIIAANELLSDRCGLYKENYPETKMFQGDIWKLKNEIISYCKNNIKKQDLFLIYATPPCQGMSTNGAGKIKSEITAGNRPSIDKRNLLIIPALEVIKKLRPKWILFENVPGMKDTYISVDGTPIKILDYVEKILGKEYFGSAKVLKCSDYGIPQLRKRLITIYTRDKKGKAFLKLNNNSIFLKKDISANLSLWDAIGHLPALDAKEGLNENKKFHPLHYVNTLNEEKYWWISNTPEGETAYNNQCVSQKCLYQGNTRHIDTKDEGKSISSKLTPIYCQKCGNLLPRPTIVDKKTGQRRLISGFHSAYRRMNRNQPARTLTRNFPFESSDNKIHPTQNRVLSIYEALVLQSISEYPYQWKIGGKEVNRSLIAQSIGESVPPKLIDLIVKRLIDISNGDIIASQIKT